LNRKLLPGCDKVNRQLLTTGIQVATRAAVGATLAVALSQLLGLQHPMYALIAAIIVTDFSASTTRKLGLKRLVSALIGACCGAVLRSTLPPSVWSLGLGISLAMFACHLSPMRDGAKVAGYMCGIVLIAYGTNSWSYAFFRLLETALGIGFAWLVSLVPKLVRIENTGCAGTRGSNVVVFRTHVRPQLHSFNKSGSSPVSH
jgi:uncharacterized membrane protein YgaE (UPF0421/DUF939 family)